jgi:hypothetical protein
LVVSFSWRRKTGDWQAMAGNGRLGDDGALHSRAIRSVAAAEPPRKEGFRVRHGGRQSDRKEPADEALGENTRGALRLDHQLAIAEANKAAKAAKNKKKG